MQRPLWIAGGLLFLGLGMVGAALPIVPTVPFLLVALLCFARGKPEWEQRLLDHPRWGQPLRDWREKRAISRRAKLSALAAMAVGALVTWLSLGFPWVLISLAILLGVGSWIWTRPE